MSTPAELKEIARASIAIYRAASGKTEGEPAFPILPDAHASRFEVVFPDDPQFENCAMTFRAKDATVAVAAVLFCFGGIATVRRHGDPERFDPMFAPLLTAESAFEFIDIWFPATTPPVVPEDYSRIVKHLPTFLENPAFAEWLYQYNSAAIADGTARRPNLYYLVNAIDSMTPNLPLSQRDRMAELYDNIGEWATVADPIPLGRAFRSSDDDHVAATINRAVADSQLTATNIRELFDTVATYAVGDPMGFAAAHTANLCQSQLRAVEYGIISWDMIKERVGSDQNVAAALCSAALALECEIQNMSPANAVVALRDWAKGQR